MCILTCVLKNAGVKLLQKMGWRPGKGIGTAAVSMQDVDEEADGGFSIVAA